MFCELMIVFFQHSSWVVGQHLKAFLKRSSDSATPLLAWLNECGWTLTSSKVHRWASSPWPLTSEVSRPIAALQAEVFIQSILFPDCISCLLSFDFWFIQYSCTHNCAISLCIHFVLCNVVQFIQSISLLILLSHTPCISGNIWILSYLDN